MKLFVERIGQGPDLALLHGWAMHSGVFAQLWPSLAENYRVHLIDLPGHGRSEFQPCIGELQALADCVQEHVPQKALLLGWSLGGLIALKLAQQLPLRAMVLVSSTPRFVAAEAWLNGMPQAVFAQFFARLQTNVEVTVQDFLSLQVRGDSHATQTLRALQQALLAHPGDHRALQLGLQILRDADERAALPNIEVPTLVISGEYDRITHPKACASLVASMPNAKLNEIKRAGHAPFISHRDEFIAAVKGFLAEHAPA